MARLVVTDGPDAGRSFALSGAEMVVGRGDGSGVRVNDLTVSREHVRLVSGHGGWALVDLGSRNRTLVNGAPVSRHILVEGDRITVGQTLFLYVAGDTAETQTLTVMPSGFEHVTRELQGLPELARGRNHLAGLYAFAEDLSHAERLDDLYPCIVRVARDKCLADRAFLFVADRGGELQTAAASAERSEQVTVSRTVVDKVLRERKSVVCADTYGDLRYSQQASIVDNAISSLICAPVVSRGRCLGILYVDLRQEGRTFTEEDLRFVTAMAQQAGIAIDNLTLRGALETANTHLRSQVAEQSNLVGESGAIGRVLDFIAKVARTDSTVMVNGESGTGKELVATAVHNQSERANGPFVAVNCAALSEQLLESELFGHEKGAFTGATELKRGRFEVSDGGTLFLDEVGELSPSCQAKFLRVLEESCFERLGGTRRIDVDVRVIAATHRDLRQMVADGQFRADLFYRLEVIQIDLPPLRDRPGDIPLLVQAFIERYTAKMGRRIDAIEPAAMEALCAYRWPGNIRELKNAIERAMVLGDGMVLRKSDLPPGIADATNDVDRTTAMGAMSLQDVERATIVATLRETGGNKAAAARKLGIDRSTLYKKIKDYGIEAR